MVDSILERLKKRMVPQLFASQPGIIQGFKESAPEQQIDIVTKIRNIESVLRGKNGKFQEALDEIFREHGVIVNYLKNGTEVVCIGGMPLRQGDIEYAKTTEAGYDHFFVYNAIDFRVERGYKWIDDVCLQFGLHAPKNGDNTIRIMSRKGGELVAELMGREREFPGQGKVMLPYDILGLKKQSMKKLEQEKELLYAIVSHVYRANCGANYTFTPNTQNISGQGVIVETVTLNE